MRSRFIVIASPGLDDLLRFLQRHEPIFIQTLASEFVIEAFNETVLDHFPGTDELMLNRAHKISVSFGTLQLASWSI
jgi:hypothetical protein